MQVRQVVLFELEVEQLQQKTQQNKNNQQQPTTQPANKEQNQQQTRKSNTMKRLRITTIQYYNNYNLYYIISHVEHSPSNATKTKWYYLNLN